ncbi:Zinc finger protein 587 [Plecturocebus cupreus]
MAIAALWVPAQQDTATCEPFPGEMESPRQVCLPRGLVPVKCGAPCWGTFFTWHSTFLHRQKLNRSGACGKKLDDPEKFHQYQKHAGEKLYRRVPEKHRL